MDDGQNDPNQNTGAPRQAIFTPSNSSTSEQTQPTTPVAPTAPENSTPAAHPYFSSHPTRTFASETGDIILNGDAPRTKTPKKGLIIGLLIFAVVVLIGVIVAVTMTGKPKTSATLTDVVADFNSYRVYLEDGPENTEKVDPDEWFLFQLDEIGLSDEEQVAYTDELQARFEKFRTDFNVAKTGLSDIERAKISNILPDYANILQVITIRETMSYRNAMIIKKYADDSEKAAEDHIKEILPDMDESSIIGQVIAGLKRSLTAELRLAAIYSHHNCIADGELDIECTNEIKYGGEFAEINRAILLQNNNLVGLSRLLKDEFNDQTAEINSALQGEENA